MFRSVFISKSTCKFKILDTLNWITFHTIKLVTVYSFAKSRRYNNESCWLIQQTTSSFKKYQITMTHYRLRYEALTQMCINRFEWLICISIKLHTFWYDIDLTCYILAIFDVEKQRKMSDCLITFNNIYLTTLVSCWCIIL